MAKRDTYRYHHIKDRKVVHRGQTNDLERREAEHQVDFGGGQIKQIGPRVTKDSALHRVRLDHHERASPAGPTTCQQ